MKKKNLNTKLAIKKTTIASLNADAVKGGNATVGCPSIYPTVELGCSIKAVCHTVANTCATCICPPPTYEVSCNCVPA